MSSGRNWIRIKGVGRTRRKLADMLLEKTGHFFHPEAIQRTNPINQHFEDCCAWSAEGIPDSNGIPFGCSVYSWDKMSDCIRGFTLLPDRDGTAIQVVADCDPK